MTWMQLIAIWIIMGLGCLVAYRLGRRDAKARVLNELMDRLRENDESCMWNINDMLHSRWDY